MHGWNFPHQPNMNPGKGDRLGAITFSNSPEAMLCTPLPPPHQTLGPGASLAVSTPLRTERPVLMVGAVGALPELCQVDFFSSISGNGSQSESDVVERELDRKSKY